MDLLAAEAALQFVRLLWPRSGRWPQSKLRKAFSSMLRSVTRIPGLRPGFVNIPYRDGVLDTLRVRSAAMPSLW